MTRKIIMAVIGVLIVGGMILRLAANKSKIDKETAFREVIENVAVNIRTVRTVQRAEEIDFTGSYKPSREVVVSAEIPGKIIDVRVREGDAVVRGQVLAKMDSIPLVLKRDADMAQYEHSIEDLARYENLKKTGATTDATLKQMRLAARLNAIAVENDVDQIARTRIRAAMDGYLTAKNFELGAVLVPGVAVGQISNMEVLKFTAMVPEYQVVKFGLRQRVSLRADVFPGVRFPGIVSLVAEKGDENHQYKVEVTVNNDNRRNPLRGGMNGSMTITGKEATITGIFIPRDALVGSTEIPRVWLVEANRAVLKKVEPGVTVGNEIQILAGLREGDRVIISGMNSLRDSATIKIAGIQ